MLAKEHKLWHAFVKSNSCMFPIANVIAKSYTKHGIAQIVAVEVEPKRVNNIIAFVDDK